MKKLQLATLGLGAALFLGCNQDSAISTKSKLETPKDKHSYAIGMDMGKSLKQIEADLDYSLLMRGIKDQVSNSPALLNDSEFQAALQDLMKEMRAERAKKDSIKSVEGLAKQSEFLAKNKAETGVQTTASGLQYLVLKEGTGASPKDGDVVVAHYVGALLDGTEFDNSVKRGQPLTFPLNRVIPGWQEALKLMKVGAKIKAWIPSELGYGKAGSPPVIPGNSLLVFEIELLEVKAGEAAAQPAVAAATAKPAAKK
jgi:FKBP-type peptidyl-prolyl cis-trans isomerase